MQKRRLGRTELVVSAVGFGGIPIQRCDKEAAWAVVRAALDRGIDFIDTARGYTDSEDKIGRAIAGRRHAVVLASKSLVRDEAAMTRDVDTTLRSLGTDVVDLYQLHAVGSDAQLDQVLGAGGAYGALDRARAAGKIRYIGVTGHSRPVLERAVRTGLFDTVQLPFNAIETEWLERVIPAARELDVGIIGMKPLAGGALSNAAAALRFALHRGVDVAIPGIDDVAQAAVNAAVGEDLRPPSPDEIDALEREKARWAGEFCRRCGYCLPCPNGLNIPMLLLLQAYAERYDLPGWARERLGGLDKHYRDCAACGACTERCPYGVRVAELMRRAATIL